MDVRILGRRGTSDFLIDAGNGDAAGAVDAKLVRVFSLDTGGFLFDDPMPLGSVVARGYWEDVDGTPEPILELVRAKVSAL